EIDSLQQQLAKAEKLGAADAAAELADLRRENKQLAARLAEAEQQAKTRGSEAGGQEMDDLRRRFEMAVQDVRELKSKNAELTEQVAKAQHAPKAVTAAAEAGGDWESRKKKLLADLDSDLDETNEAQKADKLTVQSAIKI